eukprot:TRINITY_DN2991_c0_g1_i1.p1 TRINITY_DN2991_c0_g1~~TRINITY_DN2991_c0_g1_i1.p1  ORF type:complete len:279 (-),score=29.42 TRINITY_DN2991_c0_g1_i1:491-1327(-)
MKSLKRSLSKLAALLEDGIISQDEYSCRREQLLDTFLTDGPQGEFSMHESNSSRKLHTMHHNTPQPSSEQLDSITVKIQPLSAEVSPTSLVAAFSVFGPVESAVINDGSPPYGYVNFVLPESAKKAAAARRIVIGGSNVAIRLGKSRQKTLQEAEPSNGIGLFNLPFDTTYAFLHTLLAEFAGLQSVKMIHRKDGTFKGYAFAYFDSTDAATRARSSLEGLEIGSQAIDVKFASKGAEPSGQPQPYSIPHGHFPSPFASAPSYCGMTTGIPTQPRSQW